MSMKLKQVIAGLALAIASTGTAVVATPVAAQAAPCGVYYSGDRLYIRSCTRPGSWGIAVLYSGRQICRWLSYGTSQDFARASSVDYAYDAPTRPSNCAG